MLTRTKKAAPDDRDSFQSHLIRILDEYKERKSWISRFFNLTRKQKALIEQLRQPLAACQNVPHQIFYAYLLPNVELLTAEPLSTVLTVTLQAIFNTDDPTLKQKFLELANTGLLTQNNAHVIFNSRSPKALATTLTWLVTHGDLEPLARLKLATVDSFSKLDFLLCRSTTALKSYDFYQLLLVYFKESLHATDNSSLSLNFHRLHSYTEEVTSVLQDCLRHLSFQYHKIKCWGLTTTQLVKLQQMIITYFSCVPVLTTLALDIEGRAIESTENWMQALGTILSRTPTLTTFDIGETLFNHLASEPNALPVLLKNVRNIKRLVFNFFLFDRINSTYWHTVGIICSNLPNLITVDFKIDNANTNTHNIQDAQLERLGSTLSRAPNLVKLNIGSMGFGLVLRALTNEQWPLLGEALKKAPKLTVIHLDDAYLEWFTAERWLALGGALSQVTTLSTVILSNNDLSKSPSATRSKIFSSLPATVSRVFLENNKLNLKTAANLATIFSQVPAHIFVDVVGEKFSAEQTSSIEYALDQRARLLRHSNNPQLPSLSFLATRAVKKQPTSAGDQAIKNYHTRLGIRFKN